jgi:integrase
VAALRPDRPFLILAVNGEQGSAKSTLCRMARAPLDPNISPLRRPPRDDRDLMIAASNGWVVGYDNLSGIRPELSDTLCCLATGGGFGTRELYTDDDEKLFAAMRPVLVNGIEDLATRADLLDRALTLTLPVISDERRRDEGGLWRQYEEVRPRVLGALLDALTVRKGPRKGERYAKVRPEVRERLERLGRERALIYKTLVLTGLRKGELASLTVAHLRLEDAVPYLTLDAADEKNREGNGIPLRDDLAADLRDWLADKLTRLQAEALESGTPIPARLPPDTPLFDVPSRLVKILDRDLVAAGIARRVKVNGKGTIDKRDDRGRSLDVHALRTTFGTLLSKGGVAPRTAQAAMRHSDIKLTIGSTLTQSCSMCAAPSTRCRFSLSKATSLKGRPVGRRGRTGRYERLHQLLTILYNPCLFLAKRPLMDRRSKDNRTSL